MTVPLLHPNPSSNEPAIICLTQRDTFRLPSSVTVIQATALLPHMLHSCREQSIDINLKYLSCSHHVFIYYTNVKMPKSPQKSSLVELKSISKLWEVKEFFFRFIVNEFNVLFLLLLFFSAEMLGTEFLGQCHPSKLCNFAAL